MRIYYLDGQPPPLSYMLTWLKTFVLLFSQTCNVFFTSLILCNRTCARPWIFGESLISNNIARLIQVFVVYLIPLFEYSNIPWSPCDVTDILKLESVQRRFIRRLPDHVTFLTTTVSSHLVLRAVNLDYFAPILTMCAKTCFGKRRQFSSMRPTATACCTVASLFSCKSRYQLLMPALFFSALKVVPVLLLFYAHQHEACRLEN